MFTGIVKGCGTIRTVSAKPGLSTLTLIVPPAFLAGIEIGASVAVDGVCLTVTKLETDALLFDVMQETLAKTTLGSLRDDDSVNIERAARDGAEIGGHPISGHVDCVGEICNIEQPENNYVLSFRVAPEWMKYIFPKGYLALNGTSLTIASVERSECSFKVWLIPETLRMTTFGQKKVGDMVNLEIERGTQVMVDTVRNFMEEKLGTALPKIEGLLKQFGIGLDLN